MPIYKFNCSSCDNEIEKIMKFSEADNIIKCAKCKSNMIRCKVNKISWKPGKSFYSKGFTVGKH